MTNAVKHFSFTEQGPRRLHKKPTARELAACKPWLLAELEAMQPRVVLALGASAALSLFGASVRLTRDRGRWLTVALGATISIPGLVTYHPSAILRAPTAERRRELEDWLVSDLLTAAHRDERADIARGRAHR